MQTYVINLQRSGQRRLYMQQLLAPYKFENLCFVEAVDGLLLDEQKIENSFLQQEAFKRYGRHAKLSEVGCSLSHRKCYELLLQSEEDVAFIMEDDILFRLQPEDISPVIWQAQQTLRAPLPTILLLFGEYWWTRTHSHIHSFDVKTVYDAVSAQGYLINRAAAQILINSQASSLADDWEYIISQGIRVRALYPHIIDQEWSSFETTISMDGYASLVRKELSWKRRLYTYWRGGIKRILKAIGHFEPHIIPKEEPEWAIRLGLCSPSSSPSSR